MRKLVVICGPTGTGKTDLAISLCKKVSAKGRQSSGRGEIVSADSRQVYIGADIGTNKVSANSKQQTVPARGWSSSGRTSKHNNFWIQDGVKIHLYDVTAPDKQYSASKFIDAAADIVKKIWKQGKLPFVVGGTGFYISALIGEVELGGVPADQELRDELSKNSLENLQISLKNLAPGKFRAMNNSELKNKQRLIRAIEVAVLGKLGKKRPVQKRTPLPPMDILKIGLAAPRNFLYQKADAWVKEIVKHGLVVETKGLLQKGYRNTRLLQGMIYAPMVLYLDNEISKKELIEKICFEMHAYTRRQMTWFRKDKEIAWFDVSKVGFDREVVELVESFLEKSQNSNLKTQNQNLNLKS